MIEALKHLYDHIYSDNIHQRIAGVMGLTYLLARFRKAKSVEPQQVLHAINLLPKNREELLCEIMPCINQLVEDLNKRLSSEED